jgi:hypothetical protein
MSYWSSLVLSRAAAPAPAVIAADLGDFFRALHATGALLDGKFQSKIRYGPSVDMDDLDTQDVTVDEDTLVATVGEIAWDHDATFPSVAALADELAGDSRSVYRAWFRLGDLHPTIAAALTREPSETNSDGLYLSGLCFEVGPVQIADLPGEIEAQVGWMGLSFSGPGYFYPWTYREARERAEAVALVADIAGVCRKAWPVISSEASPNLVAVRKELGKLWLYDDWALRPDWLWFASEG